MDERILVVDDDEGLLAILRDGLMHAGYVVECAADGPAALVPYAPARLPSPCST